MERSPTAGGPTSESGTAFWASPSECREVATGFACKIYSSVLFLHVLENFIYKRILFSSDSLALVDGFQGPGVFVISDSRSMWPRRAGPASPSVPQSPSLQLLGKGLRASAQTSVAGRATASGHRLPVSSSSWPPCGSRSGPSGQLALHRSRAAAGASLHPRSRFLYLTLHRVWLMDAEGTVPSHDVEPVLHRAAESHAPAA